MGQPFELGQLGNIVTVNDSDFTVGIGTSVFVTGTLNATYLTGDGTNITNAGSSLSAASGTERVVLTSQTSGSMTATSTDSNLTFDQTTGTLSATAFSGDGSNLTGIDATAIQTGTTKVQTESTEIKNVISGSGIGTFTSSGLNVTGVITATSFVGDGSGITNAGSSLSASSGTQRVVLTGQTSGTMTQSATDSTLTYNSSTGTLSADYFSGDGSNLIGVSGFATALSNDTTSILNSFFKTPNRVSIAAGTSITVESDASSGNIAFIRQGIVHVAVGATFHISENTSLLTNVLGIF